MYAGNLALTLDESVSRAGDRLALISDEGTYTYLELCQAANQLAHLLEEQGVRPGDRVALSCPNSPNFTISYFAILKAGAVVVPLNVLLKADEIAHHLRDSGACVYLCDPGTPDLQIGLEGLAGFEQTACDVFLLLTREDRCATPGLEECATLGSSGCHRYDTSFETRVVSGDDVAVILYTSGTTGTPKGAELRHRNLTSNAWAAELIFGTDATRPDVYLAALPLFHSFGQTVVQNGALAFGGTIVFLRRFDAVRALELIEQHQVTFLAGVPTMYWSILQAVQDDPDLARRAGSLRIAASGGAALPEHVHRGMQRLMGITVLEGYGLSETGPVATFSRIGEPPRVGSIGAPIPGVQMKLLRTGTWDPIDPEADVVGEIAIRGSNVMRGYHRNDPATRRVMRDGWLRTGDLGRQDDDGWYYVVDRVSDVIIRGGYNVYPREVERVLERHPAVEAVAVLGVPDDRFGEEIAAFVVLANGARSSSTELVAWARDSMAAYKYPRLITFIDRLPTTATGKVLKRALSAAVQMPLAEQSVAAASI